jgi:transforming growth factor-beta-induced protein
MKLAPRLMVLLTVLSAAACGGGAAQEPPATPDSAPEATPAASSANILETAKAAGSFTTLAAAIQAAGLEETLAGPGPFTVFAPTDDAFAKLPAGTVDNLLKPENKAKLVAVLTYHVVPGNLPAKDVVAATKLKTVQGQELTIKVDGANVTVDGAKVLKTDVVASNGVIHVIDSVVLPPG